jgi:hypothetical protein
MAGGYRLAMEVRGLAVRSTTFKNKKKSLLMKTLINKSGIYAFVIGAMFVLLLVVVLSSCAAPHWYKAVNDGCQSSQGMSGFGNRK